MLLSNALTVTQLQTSITPDSNNDRTLTIQYDRRGLKAQIQTSQVNYYDQQGVVVGAKASPTTVFEYDAFGQLVKESMQLDSSTWATTFHYYDELGRKTFSVDSEGYLSQWIYDSLGQISNSIEYARAIDKASLTTTTIPTVPAAGNAATGFDRIQSFIYDALGRKTSDVSLRHYSTSLGGLAVRNVTTSTEYNAVGNVTAVVTDGQRTETLYDAMGRMTSLTESARDVLAANWQTQLLNSSLNLNSNGLYVAASPYTETVYDAFGNVVKTTRFANGKQSGAVVADALNDQISTVRYDRQGRAVLEKDAEGIERYTAYDQADSIISKTYRLNAGSGSVVRVVASYAYDRLGRQLTTNMTRQTEVGGVLQGSASTDSFLQVRYNGFGEIIAKGNDSNLNLATALLPEQYQYDAAGRMIRSNSQTGAYRDYGYNLAGHQLVELRTVYTSGPSAVVINLTQKRDSLGRSLRQNLPLNSTTAAVSYVHQQYDRWGNTIEEIDPRNFVTRMEYNELNQLVREIQPLVKVVSETGAEVWSRPEQRWFYDALGRYVGTQDANGNIKTQQFDAAGRQIKVFDSFGNITRTSRMRILIV
jgi:large repetitive protein